MPDLTVFAAASAREWLQRAATRPRGRGNVICVAGWFTDADVCAAALLAHA